MTDVDHERVVEELKPDFARAANGRAKLNQVVDDALIIEDIGSASLDLLELRFELENRWQMRITDDEAIRMKTIGDILKLVLERSRSQASRPIEL